MHNLAASYLGTDLDRRYRLEQLIGEGASSWVFAAQDLRLEREVAVKLLKPRFDAEQTSHRKRFVAEGRTLAKLVHPHVVAVHDAGETSEGIAYLVMELSRAGSLEDELARRKTLPLEELLRLTFPLMGALACAHERGIVHRDLKPANVALARERGETRAKLLDFGIAKVAGADGTSDAAIGTPSYMAPEQARAEALGPQTDVWALGVVLFRCLTGSLPFEASSTTATLLKLVQERAPRFGAACPQLPPHVALALDRSLEPALARRYGDMRSFARALAVACRQDGLVILEQPEPIGLPEFGGWLRDADVEQTQPLTCGVPSEGVGPVSRPGPRRRLGNRVALTALAIVALLSLLAATTQTAPRRAQDVESPTRPAAISVTASSARPEPTVPNVPVTLPVAAAPEAEPAPPVVSGPARRAKRAQSTPLVPTTPAQVAPAPTDPPASPPPAAHGLVKSWDW